MKANKRGKALLEKMMENKQQRIREARLQFAAETNEIKFAPDIPVQNAEGRT